MNFFYYLYHGKSGFLANVCSVQLFLPNFKVNFKNLLGMESTNDLTLQLLSSVNNDLFFLVVVGGEIECVGATESTDILYVNVRVTCTIKLNIEENFKIRMLSFLGKGKYDLT